jgi:hypothetical protein
VRVAPPRSRAEVPWVPPYQYRCSVNPGHLVQDDRPKPPACPCWVDGQPCPGRLVRFGPGSKKDGA